MWVLRLGDELDDFCVKCRRLTNHLVVSLMDGKAAKVRCRSCYSDHDYRNEQAPPSKKELAKRKELFEAVLAGIAPPEIILEAGDGEAPDGEASDGDTPDGLAPDVETPLALDMPAEIGMTAEIKTASVPAPPKKKKR